MIKFILWLLSMLPLRINHFMGGLIGRYSYLTNTRSKSIVSKNIGLCFPELSKQAQKKLIKASLIETGKGLSESGFIWFNSFEHNAKQVQKINGIEHLQSKQPIILLAPHMGCWEIVGPVISLKRKITVLYKAPKSQQQQAFLLEKRNTQNMYLASADAKGVIKLQRALSKNELIGILPDQDPGEQGGMLVPFFGHEARTMTLLAKLARKNNAKVLMTWAKRLPKGKGYELSLEPVEVLSASGKLDDDVILMNQAIETLIKACPQQYLWSYKRFKSNIDY